MIPCCKRRSNLSLLAGVSTLIVAIWFSFLLGTIYASYFEGNGESVSRNHRQIESLPGCSCSGGQSEQKDAEKNDQEKSNVADIVLVDRKTSKDSLPEEEEEEEEDNDNAAARIPDETDVSQEPNTSVIKHQSYHLTWTRVDSTFTNIFSAYYDDRPAMHGPSIVLPGYQSKRFRNQTLFCLFRNKDGSTQCSPRKTVLREMDACNQQKEFDKKNERQFLHIFHICTLERPADDSSSRDQPVPTHVALSADAECKLPSSFIPVFSHRPKTKIDFGVCVQTPAFGKHSHDFVSFIELYKSLGAQFFTLYVANIDHQTLSFLRQTYGGENGILDIVQWTNHLREKEPIHYYGEILAIHDCLYRNMHKVKYLAFVDLDEALIPRRYRNWKTMLQEIDQPYIDSFIFANSIFMKTESEHEDKTQISEWNSKLCDGVQLPAYFTSFSRVKCVFHFFARSKLIVKPELVLDTDIHGVCTLVGNTTHYLVPEDSAVSQHYRGVPTIECRKNRKTRKYPTTYDNWMARYADTLLKTFAEKLCK